MKMSIVCWKTRNKYVQLSIMKSSIFIIVDSKDFLVWNRVILSYNVRVVSSRYKILVSSSAIPFDMTYDMIWSFKIIKLFFLNTGIYCDVSAWNKIPVTGYQSSTKEWSLLMNLNSDNSFNWDNAGTEMKIM